MGSFKPTGWRVVDVIGAEVDAMDRAALIECSTCSAVLEIHPQEITGEPRLGWSARDEGLCRVPPLRRCPHAYAEAKRRFPDFDI